MENRNKPTGPAAFMGRPRDESLQAYKDFVMAFVDALGGDTKDDSTEAEWEADWKKFWSKNEPEK